MKKAMTGQVGKWAMVTTAIAMLAWTAGTRAKLTSALEQLDLLVDVRHEIVSQYVEEPNQVKMTEAAVRAMIESLDDPYTTYITPEDLEPFDKQIRGTFTGIGAEVDTAEDRPRIVTPLDDSPAFKAGIMAGDIVLEIDGTDTNKMPISDAIRRIQGPEGTKVAIKVRHVTGQEATIVVTRAQINVQTVRGMRRDADQHWDFMLDNENKIGYIRLSQFTEATAGGVRSALDQLKAKGAKGVILDLRFNPGGLLESAIEISDMFLPAGKRIVSVKGRVTAERITMASNSPNDVTMPVVVIANEASASASEIVTGALSDNGRARFIGARTFGKGSVQQVRVLEPGEGAVKITNAYYYLPNGRNIHRKKDKDVWGVDPDDGGYVVMTPEQVTAMAKVRRDGDVMSGARGNGEVKITPEFVEKEMADPQLAAGLKSLLGKIKDDKWPVVGLSGAQAIALETQRAALTRQREALAERLEQVDAELEKLLRPSTQPATQPAPSR